AEYREANAALGPTTWNRRRVSAVSRRQACGDCRRSGRIFGGGERVDASSPALVADGPPSGGCGCSVWPSTDDLRSSSEDSDLAQRGSVAAMGRFGEPAVGRVFPGARY